MNDTTKLDRERRALLIATGAAAGMTSQSASSQTPSAASTVTVIPVTPTVTLTPLVPMATTTLVPTAVPSRWGWLHPWGKKK